MLHCVHVNAVEEICFLTYYNYAPCTISNGPFHRPLIVTVLLEYFAGEKPLQMSQISRKVDALQSNYCVLARIVCIY